MSQQRDSDEQLNARRATRLEPGNSYVAKRKEARSVFLLCIMAAILAVGAILGIRSRPEKMALVRSAQSGLVAATSAPAGSVPTLTESAPEPPSARSEEDERDARPPEPVPSKPRQHRVRDSATLLSDELALVDKSYRALTTGDEASALALAQRYQKEFPIGTLRPEAAAIQIEALAMLGHQAEARDLAREFAATYGEGLLTDRIAAFVASANP